MVKGRYGLVVYVCLFLWRSSGWSSSPIVPPDDDLYQFLERLAQRGLIPLQVITSRPISRFQVADYLHQLSSQSISLDDPILTEDLKYYQKEYAPDLLFFHLQLNPIREQSFTGKGFPLAHRRLFSLVTPDHYLVVDPLARIRGDGGETKEILRRAWGVQMWGAYGPIGGYFRFIDHAERGGGPYRSYQELLEDRWGYVGPLRGRPETSYDQAEASLTLRWKTVTFLGGRDRVSWGGGTQTNLLLSYRPPPYDQFRLWWEPSSQFRFTYLVGSLYPWGVRDTLYQTEQGWVRETAPRKWLAAHRGEISPFSWMVLGFSEAVVWGDRGLEWAYLNPINFLYSAQHSQGDQDNLLMGGDVTVRVANRGIVYMALLLDDLSTFTLGKGDASNKVGWQVSGRSSRLGLKGLEMEVEYLRLEPYVYSHFFPINAFSHWRTQLGADLPPHSDRLKLKLTFRPRREITFMVGGGLVRHGLLGGSWEKGISPQERGQKVRFLQGSKQQYFRREITLMVEPWPKLIITLGGVRNAFETTLPDRNYLEVSYRY